MIAVLTKEINDFLDSLIGYMVMGIFLIGIGLFMWIFPDTNVLDHGYASMQSLFSFGPYVFLFLIPAITMKSFAEERRSGTIEILYTLPLRERDIILGKFLAGFILSIFSILPTVIFYVSLVYLGNPIGNIDSAEVIGSYIGLVLLAGVFTSIGIFASSLTQNQIVSFTFSSFLCFLFFQGFESIAAINIWIQSSFVLKQIGIYSHYQSLSRGLVDFSDIIYFISMITLFLYMTAMVLKVQRR